MAYPRYASRGVAFIHSFIHKGPIGEKVIFGLGGSRATEYRRVQGPLDGAVDWAEHRGLLVLVILMRMVGDADCEQVQISIRPEPADQS